MKIRIKENSICYRRTKPEANEFCINGSITTRTDFNEHKLNHALKTNESATKMTVTYENSLIVVHGPENFTKEWIKDNKIGFKDNVSLDNVATMNIVVEKDFVCLNEREEDESDNYPKPKTKL